MDRQKVFDTIARGIIAQAALGLSAVGSFYRTTDGRKCGIGHLIPDSLYDERLEDCNVSQLPGYILEAIGVDGDGDVAFLDGLQKIHDTAASRLQANSTSDLPGWHHDMRTFAGRHGLSSAVLDEASRS